MADQESSKTQYRYMRSILRRICVSWTRKGWVLAVLKISLRAAFFLFWNADGGIRKLGGGKVTNKYVATHLIRVLVSRESA